MGIFIAIPFILSSFFVGLVAKKSPKPESLNRYLFVSLSLAVCVISLVTSSFTLMQASFIFALAAFYFATMFENKYVKYLLDSLAILIATAYAYIAGVDVTYLIIVLALLNFVHIFAKQNLASISVVSIQFAPIALVGLYLAQENALFALTMMTFLGSIRFFIEAKTKQTIMMFVNSYILILFFLLIGFDSASYFANSTIVFASFAFAISSVIITALIRNKRTIVERMLLVNELSLTVLFKVLAMNIIAIVLAYLFKLDIINFITFAIILLVLLASAYFKLWFGENENNFNLK
jgi:hypothetical protein